MSNWAETAYRPYGAHYRQKSLADTFGHLAPEKNKLYKGEILFSISDFGGGDLQIIDFKFNNDLSSSPWLYDALNDFLFDNFKDEGNGTVFKIKIEFKNYKFKTIDSLETICSL